MIRRIKQVVFGDLLVSEERTRAQRWGQYISNAKGMIGVVAAVIAITSTTVYTTHDTVKGWIDGPNDTLVNPNGLTPQMVMEQLTKSVKKLNEKNAKQDKKIKNINRLLGE